MTRIVREDIIETPFEALYQELKSRVENEGLVSAEAYREMVDEIVEEKRGYGFLDDDENLEKIKADLLKMWNEIKKLNEEPHILIKNG